MPQRHLILIFFLWLIWVKQSIIFNSILFLHYVTCSQGQHWHAGWKLVPSTSLHPLVVSISSTLLKAALLLPLLGLFEKISLEMLCCAFPRFSCGWLCPAWQKSSAGSWAGCLNLHEDVPCSPCWIHSWSWADQGPFGKIFVPTFKSPPGVRPCFQLLQCLRFLWQLLPAPPADFSAVLSSMSVPKILKYPEKSWKRKKSQISNLFAGDEIFPYSALTSLQSFPLFYFFSWKASPFLPELSVPRQLSQPRIWAAQRMAVLKSLSFAFHVFLSLGSPTLQPAVTSSSGHSANPALPREVCGGISCCSGNSSYSSNSLPLLGAPVFGSCCCILGDFHSITFYKWSGCTKDLFKIKKLSLNSGSGWIREYVM